MQVALPSSAEILAKSSVIFCCQGQIAVQLRDLAVVYVEEPYSVPRSWSPSALALAAFFLNECENGITRWFIHDIALYDLITSHPQIPVPAFGDIPVICVKPAGLVRRCVNASVGNQAQRQCVSNTGHLARHRTFRPPTEQPPPDSGSNRYSPGQHKLLRRCLEVAK